MGMLVIRKYMGGIFMNNQVKEIIEEMKKEKKRLSMEMETSQKRNHFEETVYQRKRRKNSKDKRTDE